MIMFRNIHAELQPGTDIDRAVDYAVKLGLTHHTSVTFKWNGIKVTVKDLTVTIKTGKKHFRIVKSWLNDRYTIVRG